MKRLIYPITAFVIVIASAFTVITSQNWTINEDYSIRFTSKEPSGIFKGLKGNIIFDEKNPGESKFDVTIDVATINTGNGMMNNHAKNAQWFDAEKYPVIKFTSNEITKTSSGYQAKGDLELHGVKKEYIIPFTFQNTDKGGIFTGSFDVNRLDFNMGDAKHASTILKIDISVPVSKS